MTTTQINAATIAAVRDRIQALYDGLGADERLVLEALLTPPEDEVAGYFMTPGNKAGTGIVVDNGRSIVVDNGRGVVVDNARVGILIDNGVVAFRPIVIPPSR